MGLYNTPQPGLPGLFGGGGQVPGMAPQAPGMPQMPAQMPQQQGGAMSLPYLAMLAALLQRMGAGGASPFGMGGGAPSGMPIAQSGMPSGMPMAPRPMLPPQVR